MIFKQTNICSPLLFEIEIVRQDTNFSGKRQLLFHPKTPKASKN
jgi:hypothetical protein